MGQGNRRASDVFVECLVPVRHEQGGAYIADIDVAISELGAETVST